MRWTRDRARCFGVSHAANYTNPTSPTAAAQASAAATTTEELISYLSGLSSFTRTMNGHKFYRKMNNDVGDDMNVFLLSSFVTIFGQTNSVQHLDITTYDTYVRLYRQEIIKATTMQQTNGRTMDGWEGGTRSERNGEVLNGLAHSIVEFIVFHFYGRKHVI